MRILFLLFISFNISAGLVVEPYAGFIFGKFESTISNEDYKYNTTGITFGSRVGYSVLYFVAGMDLSFGSMDATVSSGPIGTTSEEYDTSSFGLYAGVNFPILMRGWVTYYLNSSYENRAKEELNGSGFGIGLGFTPLPLLSLNIETKFIKVNEIDSNSGTIKLPNSNRAEDSINEILLSVSLPFEL